MSDDWNRFDYLPGGAQDEINILWAIANAVAEMPAAQDDTLGEYCVFCNLEARHDESGKWRLRHRPDCPVILARSIKRT